MQPVLFAIQTAVVAYLVLGEPFVGTYWYARMNLNLETDPGARSRFYRSIILLEWFLVAVVLGSFYLAGEPLERLGLGPLAENYAVLIVAAFFAAFLVGLGLLTRYFAGIREYYARNLSRVGPTLPRSGRERLLFGVTSITAGICDEVLFRGFLLWYVGALVPGLPIWALVAISAVIFGLAHAYQGWSGILSSGALGAIFAFFYLKSGSLYMVMLWHTLIDLQALVISWAVQAAERKAA